MRTPIPPRSAALGLAAALLLAAACSRDERGLEVGGERRSYQLAQPSSGSAAGVPLVFVFHGFGDSAKNVLAATDLAKRWPEAVVVAPQGLPRTLEGLGAEPRAGWQTKEGELGDRDLAFFDALLERLVAELPVDLGRVYATGFSNGASFTNLLGCARADEIAAIAPVAGSGPVERRCGLPTPALVIHGSADGVIPYERGRKSWERWREVNECGTRQEARGSSCFAGVGCDADALLCTFPGAHLWPPGTSGLITDFFKDRRRR